MTTPAAVRRRRRLVQPAATLIAATAACGYVRAIDPNSPGHYPTCPFLAVSGLFCPGCGTLRAIHALTHGDLGEAVGLNVFTVSMLPLLSFLWLRWAVASLRDRPSRTRAADPRLIWLLLVAIIVFWVVRNLPLGAALAP